MRVTAVGLLCLLVPVLAPSMAAAKDPIEPFVGKFEGKATSKLQEGLAARDLNFEISKTGKGFVLRWTTIIPKENGAAKRTSFRIQFNQSRRPKLFAAAMRRNVFGAPVPLDPLKGDPYMWASIRGNTLGVYGIHVTEDGGYELQVYERTLASDGMKIVFKRIRNGKQLRDITGFAKRVK